MASSPTNGWNVLGDTDSNTPGPFDYIAGNDAFASTPTFADIKANAATFAPRRRRRPFVFRRYISELKRPLGYRRPQSPYIAKERMRAKLDEFDNRFSSAQTYDQFCEPVSHFKVPYNHAHVLDIVAPWMYPYYEDDHLSGMMARV
ncbi:hypothetical protein CCMA1212_009485 [Trichoderma ghanense]|uniref:Uncharacterized protein n=1 Tax=Trichoderma ghanense TaxID=65468 RepID=A0ABY2GUL8_9HYPO